MHAVVGRKRNRQEDVAADPKPLSLWLCLLCNTHDPCRGQRGLCHTHVLHPMESVAHMYK